MLPRRGTSLLSGGARKSAISLALNGGHPGVHSHHGAPLRARLAARSRLTNLGVVILLAVSAFSLLFNIRYVLFKSTRYLTAPPPGFTDWTTFHGVTPNSLQENVPPPTPGTEKLTHLVLVPGHAVWAGQDFAGRQDDNNWILTEYQKGGSVKTFWKHIQRGIQIAAIDASALLIFSGGQTRPQSLLTEAESYFSLAIASGMEIPVIPTFNFSSIGGAQPKHGAPAKDKGWFGGGKAAAAAGPLALAFNASEAGLHTTPQGATHHVGANVAGNAGVPAGPAHLALQGLRMTTENFALDSFENLLFAVARFREYTGVFPERITVVGFLMKKPRFENLHAKAIRWPTRTFVGHQPSFRYVGIDDEGPLVEEEYEGERIKAYSQFERDMYGCHGLLLAKRRDRNPTRRYHPYFTSAPELADLLDWCPADGLGLQGIYRASLPWDLRVDEGWGRAAKKLKEQGKLRPAGPIGDSRWGREPN